MNIWPTRKLGEVARLVGGSTPSREDPNFWGGSIPWLSPSELPMPGKGIAEVSETRERITDRGLASCAAEILPPGSVLFSSRATIGKLAIACAPLTTNQGFVNFIPGPDLNSRYLAYTLLHFTEPIVRLAGSTTFKEVSRTSLREFKIPVPPLAKQEQIVRIIDQADQLRRLRAEADRRTEELIPALFYEMFSDHISNGLGHHPSRLEEVCISPSGIKAGPFGSSLKKECYTTEGPRVYGQEQIIAGDFTVGDYHISQAKYDEMHAYSVCPGDVLVSLVGTFGKIAVVPENFQPGIINPRLIRIRVNKEVILPIFLKHYLELKETQAHLQSLARGQTMGVLNATLLREVTLPVPPLGQQSFFAAYVAEIQSLQTEQEAGRLRVDDLFESLLYCAFQGEL